MANEERQDGEGGAKVVDFFVEAARRRNTPDISLQWAQAKLDAYVVAESSSPLEPLHQGLLVQAAKLFFDGVKKVRTGEYAARITKLADDLVEAMRPWNMRRGTSIDLVRAYAEVAAYRMRDPKEVTGAARRLEEMGGGDPATRAAAQRILRLVDEADAIPPALTRETVPPR